MPAIIERARRCLAGRGGQIGRGQMLVVALLPCLLVCLLLAGCIEPQTTSISDSSRFDADQLARLADRPAPPKPAKTALLTFVGDTMLGDEWGSSAFQRTFDAEGPAYFLANVRELFAADDLTVANLECPLTDSTAVYPKGENVEGEVPLYYWYKGLPQNAQILSEGSVELVNIANNHIHDFGSSGFNDTFTSLEAVGVAAYGYDRTFMREVNGIQIGLFGFAFNTDANQIAAAIAGLREQGAELVFATFHEGADFASTETSPNQRTAAYAAIDAGADAVIEHHSHRVQGIEYYNERLVVYSLANFCYGGSPNPADKDTLVLQIRITEIQGDYLADKTGISAVDHNGYSLAYELLPASISSVSNTNNYQPSLLSDSEAQRVLARVDELSAAL